MSNPTLNERKNECLGNISSYFFSNILRHIITNENTIITNRKNSFIDFILGFTNKKPSTNELIATISQGNDENLKIALDVLFMFGKKYESQIKSIGYDLVAKKQDHDVFQVYCSSENWDQFEEKLSRYVRSMFIRKCDVKFLSLISKIGCAKNEDKQFNAICELCFDSEWDAYILIKLFGLEKYQQTEFELIRTNILGSLQNGRPKLVNLIKIISSNDVVGLMNEFPKYLDEINIKLIDKINPLLNQNDVGTMEICCQYICDVWYILLKISLTQEPEFAKTYIQKLPDNIRSKMFEDLDLMVFETAFHLLKSFVTVFSSDGSKEEYPAFASSLNEDLRSHWKRQAILRILSSFRNSMTQSNIGVLCPLVNDKNVCAKIIDVFKFLTWIIGNLENYGCVNLLSLPVESKLKLILIFKHIENKAKLSVEQMNRVMKGSDISTITPSKSNTQQQPTTKPIEQKPTSIVDLTCSAKELWNISNQSSSMNMTNSTDWDEESGENTLTETTIGSNDSWSLGNELTRRENTQNVNPEINFESESRRANRGVAGSTVHQLESPTDKVIEKIRKLGGAETKLLYNVSIELTTLYKNNCSFFAQLVKEVEQFYGMQARSLRSRITRNK
ncbi:unnamed protein product [Caenorhabditis angaria]|uniref:Uncharacterized protein n=1 Tax=Caenorhabditis angaria TaxID=860376 RepID=A0A9P1IIB8_9PELO|nr:unnamed protein product [Caenorhabditis angaria]